MWVDMVIKVYSDRMVLIRLKFDAFIGILYLFSVDAFFFLFIFKHYLIENICFKLKYLK